MNESPPSSCGFSPKANANLPVKELVVMVGLTTPPINQLDKPASKVPFTKKLTDGGSVENIYSIFDHIKTINKYSSDDKYFTVINHVASILKGELTIDNTREIEFTKLLNDLSVRYNIIKGNAGKIFLEGNIIKITPIEK